MTECCFDQIAVVSGQDSRVHSVVRAAGRGQAINPDPLEAHMLDGIIFGHTVALESVTAPGCTLRHSSLHDDSLPLIDELPVGRVAKG